eukprot:9106694-Pyramimonas_sp.AAC.2
MQYTPYRATGDRIDRWASSCGGVTRRCMRRVRARSPDRSIWSWYVILRSKHTQPSPGVYSRAAMQSIVGAKFKRRVFRGVFEIRLTVRCMNTCIMLLTVDAC